MDSRSPHTIFIPDDDDAARDSLQALLEARHFTVIAFDSGSDLFRRPDHADCLVLDLHMPLMTGAELLTKLRQRGDKTPAILITGRPDRAAQSQARTLGVPLLEKPVSPKLLLATLDAALTPGALGLQAPPAGPCAGIWKRKIEPPFGFGSAQMRPPCASMIERLMDKPMPMPLFFVVTNGLKSC